MRAQENLDHVQARCILHDEIQEDPEGLKAKLEAIRKPLPPYTPPNPAERRTYFKQLAEQLKTGMILLIGGMR